MNNIIKNNGMAKQNPFFYLLASLLLSSSVASAKDIKGKVTDAATGTPLAGVSIEAYDNRKYAAITDKDGQYTINVPDHVSSLYMRLEGSLPQQVAIGSDLNNVNAKLYNDSFSGYYSRATETSKVSAATGFDNNAEVSIDPFIQQRLNGQMRSVNRSGIEGVGNMMLINGINSLNTNVQPLVVVDGVIMDMQYDRMMIHDGYYNNILANLNVNDIEKVEVLRNGSAIYGSKAANGVLLITTKRNKSMATKIDLTIGGKFQLQPRTAEVLNATDYRTYATEMLSGIVRDPQSFSFLNADPKYYYYNMYHNETDWKKEVYREAFTQNYGINVQGGDDVANYNLSVGYALSDQTLKENDFSRFDMRLNTDISILPKLDVRFDAAFSDVKRRLFDVGTVSYDETGTPLAPSFLSLIKSPFLSPYAIDINGNQSNFLAEADDYLGTVMGSNYFSSIVRTHDRSLANPTAILEYGTGEERNSFGNRLVTFTITPKFQFNKHLALQEAFNFSLVNTNEDYYSPVSGVPLHYIPNISDRYIVNNTRQSMTARQNSIQSDTRLTWDNTYGVHGIKVMGGVRYINNTYRLSYLKGYDTGNDKTPNLTTGLKYKTSEGADDKFADVTTYVSADYNYAQKFYLTGGISAMASSRFGKNASGLKALGTVWGLFPNVQAAYVLTNEKWLADVKGIDYLRVNAGFDVTGNDNIDYTASRTYFVGKLMLENKTGLYMANVGNSKLQWETTKRFNAGFEGNFLDNRLHVGFNWFKSWTTNLLALQRMAWTTGLDNNWGNNGKLENSGYSVDFSYRLLNNRNFHWEAGASVGHYDNKVTQLSDNNKSFTTQFYDATILTAVGNPVGLFYGYKTNGVFATTEEADKADLGYLDKTGKKVNFQAGDMKFVDQDGDGIISEADRVVIGNPNPDIYGNIFTHLNYKKWSLDATLTYSLGNDVYNYERNVLESGKYFYNQTTAMNRRWTTEGQVTDIPRISHGDKNGNSRFSDRWIEDGSYLRLSNITLSYSLPINSTFLQGITVWGAANNLFTVTKYLGSNPDCSASNNILAQGIDRGLLGVGRSFSMGVKVNL